MWEELIETIGKFNGKFNGYLEALQMAITGCDSDSTEFDLNIVDQWFNERGYDYVSRNGNPRTREDFETMAADAVDDLHEPITVLGRTLKVSDIAREMLSLRLGGVRQQLYLASHCNGRD